MQDDREVIELVRQSLVRELESLPGDADQTAVGAACDRCFDNVERAGVHLAADVRQALVWRAYDQLDRLGPLGTLLRDPNVTEIMVNGPFAVFVEEGGVKRRSAARFENEHALRQAIERMLALAPGKRLDVSQPIVDLSLPDGSRVSIVVPPAVAGSAHITIRRYTHPIDRIEGYVTAGAMDDRMAAFLVAAIRGRVNLLFSGAAASGKTTLLEVLSRYMDDTDRIVVIEDTLELHLHQPNVVRLLTRTNNLEGKGEITIGDLFRASLRMRPSRILLGEIRGREALDYLHAVTSGHGGTCGVLHAASPAEAVVRLENLVPYAGIAIPPELVRRQIADGVGVIVQLRQYRDGVRRVAWITAVEGLDEGGFVRLVDLFRFDHRGVDADGRVTGEFVALPAAAPYIERLRR
jgi:pilus assembly protein CpaF